MGFRTQNRGKLKGRNSPTKKCRLFSFIVKKSDFNVGPMENEMQSDPRSSDDRPKWLKVTLACLSSWLTCVFSFFFFSFVILSAVNALFRIDGLPGPAGVAALVVFAGMSVLTSAFIAKWQHRLLSRRSRRTNYIVLAIMIILTILFVPSPYTYVII